MQDQGNEHPRDEDNDVRGDQSQHDEASTDPETAAEKKSDGSEHAAGNGTGGIDEPGAGSDESATETDDLVEQDGEQPDGLELSGLEFGSASDGEGKSAPELPKEAARWEEPELPEAPESPEEPELPLQSGPSFEAPGPMPPAEDELPLESMMFEEILSSEPAPDAEPMPPADPILPSPALAPREPVLPSPPVVPPAPPPPAPPVPTPPVPAPAAPSPPVPAPPVPTPADPAPPMITPVAPAPPVPPAAPAPPPPTSVSTETPRHRPGPPPGPAGIFLDQGPDGILYLTFNHPEKSVNVFTAELLAQLEHQLDEIARATDTTAVIVRSFKPNCFIAGADLDSIAAVTDKAEAMETSRYGQRVFAKVATMRVPIVAAIDGSCLGGGAEFALACHYRLLSDRKATRIGLPEVKLGILPAWGGTQRLPQIVGLTRALDLILTGRSIDGQRARRLGLADAVIPQGIFAGRVLEYTQQVVEEARGPRRAGPQLSFSERLIERNPLGRRRIFSQAADRLFARTRGHYPAPPRALEAVQIGIERGNRAGFLLESTFLAELVTGPVCKNLVRLFFATEAVKKTSGVEERGARPRRVEKLGLLGAGVMGGGIAYLASSRDLPVRVKDVEQEALSRALSRASSLHQRQVERRRGDPRTVEQQMALISPTLDYTGFGRADLVIEAVAENLEIKRRVLREVEEVVGDDCVIATNTSSLLLADMASALRRPGRFAGMHFFNPVHRMALVEVVRGERSEPATIATIRDLARRLGKTPIVVADRPGFLVNRVLMPYLNEACVLLQEGVPIEQIDQAMYNFGMPMGPLRLLDEIGLDIAHHVSRVLAEAFADHVRPSTLLGTLVEGKRLGKKGGRGFYRFEGVAEPMPDGEAARIARSLQAASTGEETGPEELPIITDIQTRLVLPMINEAARCLEEGVVQRPLDVDLAMVLGTGFPPFRGGLLRYAESLGIDEVAGRLASMADGGRAEMAPAALLVEMARDGALFY